eukprot:4737372-Pleurochrysis_carterae.AAC.2
MSPDTSSLLSTVAAFDQFMYHYQHNAAASSFIQKTNIRTSIILHSMQIVVSVACMAPEQALATFMQSAAARIYGRKKLAVHDSVHLPRIIPICIAWNQSDYHPYQQLKMRAPCQEPLSVAVYDPKVTSSVLTAEKYK